MDKKSLFSKHVALITTPPSSWTPEQKAEWESIQKLDLPPLKLTRPEKKHSLWEKFKTNWQYTFSALAVTSLALMIIPGLRNTEDTLTAKGSAQISVYWERDSRISPLTSDSDLKDGDKIGAKVITSEDSIAYWTITDKNLKVLDSIEEIKNSQLDLLAGISQDFKTSFQLTSPNQGENLIVIICPVTDLQKKEMTSHLVMDQALLSEVIEKKNKKTNSCMYAGFRLRKAP
jgi:hypothetical protein